MRYRAVLFDLDGCLSDSTPAIVRSHKEALRLLGLPCVTEERLRMMIGPPLQLGVTALLEELGLEKAAVDALLSRYIAMYREDYRKRFLAWAVSPPGMSAAVQALAEQAVLAVATSKPREFALPLVEVLGFASLFVVVVGTAGDADPESKTVTVARALEALEMTGGVDVVMVGDRSHDIEGGRANSCATIGVTWGIGTAGELQAAGADHVIDTPSQLVEHCFS